MSALDPQYATLWLLFAGVVAVVLALRLAARRRRRDPAAAPGADHDAGPANLKRARLMFLLALIALALILTAAIQRLLR